MTDNQRLAIDRLSLYKEAKRDIEATHQKLYQKETQCNRITRSCDSIMQDSGQKDSAGNKIYVPMVVQQSGGNSREGMIDSLMDLRTYYWGQCIEAERLCRELELSISEYCPGVYGRILSMHYLYNVSLERLTVMENYTYRHIKRLKWKALEKYGGEYGEYNGRNLKYSEGI